MSLVSSDREERRGTKALLRGLIRWTVHVDRSIKDVCYSESKEPAAKIVAWNCRDFSRS